MSSDTPRLPKGPKPHKFVADKGGYLCANCNCEEDHPIHVVPKAADADPPPGDPDTGN